MTSRVPFAGVQKTCLALVAAAGSFVAGVLMPVDPPSEPATVKLTNTYKPAIKLDLEFSSVKAVANRRVEQWRSSITQGEDEGKKKLVFSPPASFQGKIVQQAKLADQEKFIALTFDDGPWIDTTEKVLNILINIKLKQPFFGLGNISNFTHILPKKL